MEVEGREEMLQNGPRWQLKTVRPVNTANDHIRYEHHVAFKRQLCLLKGEP